jgi:hypothetical protein
MKKVYFVAYLNDDKEYELSSPFDTWADASIHTESIAESREPRVLMPVLEEMPLYLISEYLRDLRHQLLFGDNIDNTAPMEAQSFFALALGALESAAVYILLADNSWKRGQ